MEMESPISAIMVSALLSQREDGFFVSKLKLHNGCLKCTLCRCVCHEICTAENSFNLVNDVI